MVFSFCLNYFCLNFTRVLCVIIYYYLVLCFLLLFIAPKYNRILSSMFLASLQNGADKLISPLALRQMVQIFVGVAMEIKYEEHIIMRRCAQNMCQVKA